MSHAEARVARATARDITDPGAGSGGALSGLLFAGGRAVNRCLPRAIWRRKDPNTHSGADQKEREHRPVVWCAMKQHRSRDQQGRPKKGESEYLGFHAHVGEVNEAAGKLTLYSFAVAPNGASGREAR
jgi:hypothetical protein